MRVVAEQIEPRPTGLIPVESVNALELFTGGGLDNLLQQVEQAATDFEADVTTAAGRKLFASQAYKVARSKTTIDDAGKTLVADWKKKAGQVDAGRKKARDFLDALRDRVRQPLTDWENEQARIEEEKRLAVEAEKVRIAAEAEAALRERERLVAEREAEIERQRQERERAEREEAAAADRKAREERIRAEAEEKAKREAEQDVQRERERAEQAEHAKKEAEEKAERDRIAAAEKAEKDRLASIEAERQKAAREAEERERSRLAEEERKRREEAARAADKAIRDTLNAAIVAAFGEEGIDAATAEKIIQLVAGGRIPSMSIRY